MYQYYFLFLFCLILWLPIVTIKFSPVEACNFSETIDPIPDIECNCHLSFDTDSDMQDYLLSVIVTCGEISNYWLVIREG